MKKAAIYHFTNGSDTRKCVYLKVIKKLKAYSKGQGFRVIDVYVDRTLIQVEHNELNRLLRNKQEYECIFVKDFYHLAKNTGACFEILRDLDDDGIKVLTIEDGAFEVSEAPLKEKLKVAVYYNKDMCDYKMLDTQRKIFQLFVKTKTNWTILEEYVETSGCKTNDGQIEFQKLIEDKEKYDLILTNSFNAIHWRTSGFCKRRQEVGKDIYSLYEGYLEYKRKENNYEE